MTGCLLGCLTWPAARLWRCPDFAPAGCFGSVFREDVSESAAAALECAAAPETLDDCVLEAQAHAP